MGSVTGEPAPQRTCTYCGFRDAVEVMYCKRRKMTYASCERCNVLAAQLAEGTEGEDFESSWNRRLR